MRTDQPLAIKYRPSKWSEVVGQDKVVHQLKGMLQSHRIPNAMMFVGPSGVGKTTLARLFTRYLNCETNELCGKCLNCNTPLSADNNFMEINAAEARGIDDVRAIISKLRFRPSVSGAFRVFLVDEAHQFTPQAFQALLKPLEDMPSSSLIIFSTTNPEKFPPAIRGRCLTLGLDYVDESNLMKNIMGIAKKEAWKEFKDKSIIERIIQASGGQVRDSLQLMEALHYSYVSSKDMDVSLDKVLGSVTKENKTLILLLLSIIAQDSTKIFAQGAKVTNWFEALQKMGWGLLYLLETMTESGKMWKTPFNKELEELFNKAQKKGADFEVEDLFLAGRLIQAAKTGLVRGDFEETFIPMFLVENK